MWTLEQHKKYAQLVIRNYKKKQITKDCMRYLIETSKKLVALGTEGRISSVFQ